MGFAIIVPNYIFCAEKNSGILWNKYSYYLRRKNDHEQTII